MPDQRGRDPIEADEIVSYWNSLVSGEAQPGTLDADLSETIWQVHQLDDAPAPSGSFRRQLREQLMHSPSTTASIAVGPFAPNGTWHEVPTRISRGDRETRSRLWRWSATHLATAALILLTLFGIYLAFGRDHDPRTPAGVIETPVSPVPPAPPTQPATGPGGADYRYPAVTATFYGTTRQDAQGYWLFEPEGGASEPLPVIIFLTSHGELQSPDNYRAWIDHLVRHGAIVIAPNQVTARPPRTKPEEVLPNIQGSVRSALAELATGTHAPADASHQIAIGHELGAEMALAYTANAATADLPVPGGVLAVFAWDELPRDLSGMPETTRIVLAGGEGNFINLIQIERLWADLPAVSDPSLRAYVHLASDDHGDPPLDLQNFSVAASGYNGDVDALDWYGTWKFADALLTCTTEGSWCEYAFGNTSEQRFMGVWSDGTPVKEITVIATSGPPA
jgi:hypothetical protein